MRSMHPPTSHFENVFDVVAIFPYFRTSFIAISLTPSARTVISKSLRPVIRNYVFLLSILSRIQITATAGIFCS